MIRIHRTIWQVLSCLECYHLLCGNCFANVELWYDTIYWSILELLWSAVSEQQLLHYSTLMCFFDWISLLSLSAGPQCGKIPRFAFRWKHPRRKRDLESKQTRFSLACFSHSHADREWAATFQWMFRNCCQLLPIYCHCIAKRIDNNISLLLLPNQNNAL